MNIFFSLEGNINYGKLVRRYFYNPEKYFKIIGIHLNQGLKSL